jgi:hypothetical protein
MRRAKPFRFMAGVLLLLAQSSAAVSADVYAQATAGREKVVTQEYFGIHFHRLVLNPDEKAIRTMWPSLAFGSVRLWDSGTLWSEVAPKAGQWNFGRMDAYVGEAGSHGASVLYTLGGTPRWASARPEERCSYGYGCAAEPVRLAHWEEYVRRVAQRYQGQVGAFELWNEPYFSDIARDRGRQAFFTGSVADMVGMARAARRVLDEASPGSILAAPGFVNGPDRLDLFLEAGGKDYVQAIDYHFYATDADHFIRQMLEVREIMRRHGVGDLPLWNTEQGVEVHPDSSPLPREGAQVLTRKTAAARMAQYLVLGAAAGLDRFYYYAWDNDRSGMVTRSGDRLPAHDAMARVQAWLIGARMKGCASPARGLVVCRTEREGQAALIAWASHSGEQALKLPGEGEILGVETLLPDTVQPAYRAQRGMLKIALGLEPVRIALGRQIPQ